jgi:hypothetical protein
MSTKTEKLVKRNQRGERIHKRDVHEAMDEMQDGLQHRTRLTQTEAMNELIGGSGSRGLATKSEMEQFGLLWELERVAYPDPEPEPEVKAWSAMTPAERADQRLAEMAADQARAEGISKEQGMVKVLDSELGTALYRVLVDGRAALEGTDMDTYLARLWRDEDFVTHTIAKRYLG